MAHYGAGDLKRRGRASDSWTWPAMPAAAAVAAAVTALIVAPPAAAQARTASLRADHRRRRELRACRGARRARHARALRAQPAVAHPSARRRPHAPLPAGAAARRLATPARRTVTVHVSLSSRHGRAPERRAARTSAPGGPLRRRGRGRHERRPRACAGAGRGHACTRHAPAPGRAAAAPSDRPRRAPRPPASASLAAGDAAAPRSSASAAPTLFAPTSVWNAPLADNAPLDPAEQRARQDAARHRRAEHRRRVGAVDRDDGTPRRSTPCPPISRPSACSSTRARGRSACSRPSRPCRSRPTPRPAAGPDAHMTIWQPSTDRLWELFQARKLADGWHASFGGAMSSTSTLARLLRHRLLARALAVLLGRDGHQPARRSRAR